MLEVLSLCCGYSNDILHNICFSLKEKKIVGVLGYNGCGKTTLIRALCGFISYRGKVLWNGKDISKLSVRNRAKIITCMPQIPPSTRGILAIDYATMGLYSRKTLLENKNNNDIILKYAKQLGIEALLYKDLSFMSVGERQMASLLRICVQDTPCILFDEPTAALDMDNSYKLLKYIEKLRDANKVILCVFHDPSLALNYCDTLFLLKEGEIYGEIECKACTQGDSLKKLKNFYPDLYIGWDKKINKYYCCYL